MNTKSLIAAAVLGLAAGQAALAQDAIPPNNWTNSALPAVQTEGDAASPSSRGAVAGSGTEAGPVAAFSDRYPERGTSHIAFTSRLTRSEVLADLEIYRESGLALLEAGDSPMWDSPAYAQAQARYAQLRSSPYYATLVQRMAAQRGESVAVAAAQISSQ